MSRQLSIENDGCVPAVVRKNYSAIVTRPALPAGRHKASHQGLNAPQSASDLGSDAGAFAEELRSEAAVAEGLAPRPWASELYGLRPPNRYDVFGIVRSGHWLWILLLHRLQDGKLAILPEMLVKRDRFQDVQPFHDGKAHRVTIAERFVLVVLDNGRDTFAIGVCKPSGRKAEPGDQLLFATDTRSQCLRGFHTPEHTRLPPSCPVT
jgi:hypothetical protein